MFVRTLCAAIPFIRLRKNFVNIVCACAKAIRTVQLTNNRWRACRTNKWFSIALRLIHFHNRIAFAFITIETKKSMWVKWNRNYLVQTLIFFFVNKNYLAQALFVSVISHLCRSMWVICNRNFPVQTVIFFLHFFHRMNDRSFSYTGVYRVIASSKIYYQEFFT